jgi:hypothetical protein
VKDNLLVLDKNQILFLLNPLLQMDLNYLENQRRHHQLKLYMVQELLNMLVSHDIHQHLHHQHFHQRHLQLRGHQQRLMKD